MLSIERLFYPAKRQGVKVSQSRVDNAREIAKIIKMATYKNSVVQLNDENQIILWNPEGQNVIAIPATTELLKELQHTTEVKVCNIEDTSANNIAFNVSEMGSKSENSQAASWKDDYTVKKLIELWKTNQALFKSSKVCNEIVWSQIAKELQNFNPNWIYTGTQCENKIKDVRKNYVKVKDHANSTGGERKTCKFYEEMEEVFGEKPCIKPVAIASTLRKRLADDSLSALTSAASSTFISTSEEDETAPPRRRGRIEKGLQEWAMLIRQESQRKEIEKERRYKEKLEKQEKAIKTYQDLMAKLIDKL